VVYNLAPNHGDAGPFRLALHRLEGNDAPIYDGAWCEYEADGDLPVVEGAA